MTRNLVRAFAAALAFFFAGDALAQAPASPDAMAQTEARLRDRGLSGSGAYEILESLTTEVGPRPAGSPAIARAKDWALAKLTSLGFSNVHAEPFTIWAWFKGVETAEVTAPFPQPMVITGLGGSVATPPGGIEAEIVLFPTFEALQAAPMGSLTGRIAVLTEHMGSNESATGYGAANKWRRKGASEAARRGAIGFMLRSLATNNVRQPHSGAMNYDEGVAKVPAVALSGPDADQLERMARRGKPIRVKFTLLPTYLPEATTWNVVGEIPGRAAPDEVVLVSGHLDSWGLGTGAIDDGAGDAIAMAAARLAGERKPRRTIRVVLWGAEETDQAGGAYAKAHAADASRIVIAGESDFGAQHVVYFQVPAGSADHPAIRTLAETLKPLGVALNPEPSRYGGDDVGHLVPLGVPQLAMRQEGAHYFDIHHSAEDTLDKVDPAELDKAAAAWAATIYAIAESGIDFRKAMPVK
ncbi:MAG: peptidase family protein [Caulobacteraceae bacterium]|nr:peptidase family protein [Caulobacteraceae bacterium]